MQYSVLITKTRRGHVVLKIKSTAEPKPRAQRWKSRMFCRKFVANKERRFPNRRGIMGKRRRAREAAVQYHFWRDLQRGEGPDKIDEFWEFCPAPERVREFAQPLIEGMVAHLPDIDERIRRYCENYEFRRISAVIATFCGWRFMKCFIATTSRRSSPSTRRSSWRRRTAARIQADL